MYIYLVSNGELIGSIDSLSSIPLLEDCLPLNFGGDAVLVDSTGSLICYHIFIPFIF